jgi:D-sedoheptulose 7-phosphate isomerase
MSAPSHAEGTELPLLLIQHAEARLQHVRAALEAAAPDLAAAAESLLATCLQGQRVYLCPQTETQALAERAASLMLRGMIQPRPGLPVILLRPLPGEGPGCVQQIGSLAAPGDALLAFGGVRMDGLEALIDTAHLHDMRLILLGGPVSEGVASRLREDDLVIRLDTPCPASQHEAGLAAVHALCDALDQRLLGLA